LEPLMGRFPEPNRSLAAPGLTRLLTTHARTRQAWARQVFTQRRPDVDQLARLYTSLQSSYELLWVMWAIDMPIPPPPTAPTLPATLAALGTLYAAHAAPGEAVPSLLSDWGSATLGPRRQQLVVLDSTLCVVLAALRASALCVEVRTTRSAAQVTVAIYTDRPALTGSRHQAVRATLSRRLASIGGTVEWGRSERLVPYEWCIRLRIPAAT
jgi:hypothetical protein